MLARGLMGGSVLTVVLLAVLGAVSLAGFDAVFTRFHLISFSNDLWRLDPRTDYLIRLFPEGFFLDTMLIVAGLTVSQAMLAGTAAGAFLWWRRSRDAPSKLAGE